MRWEMYIQICLPFNIKINMAQHIPKYQDGSKFQERIVVGEGDNKQELILDGVTFARLVGNLPSKTKRDKKIRDEVHRI